jgi:hypothetical protein
VPIVKGVKGKLYMEMMVNAGHRKEISGGTPFRRVVSTTKDDQHVTFAHSSRSGLLTTTLIHEFAGFKPPACPGICQHRTVSPMSFPFF